MQFSNNQSTPSNNTKFFEQTPFLQGTYLTSEVFFKRLLDVGA